MGNRSEFFLLILGTLIGCFTMFLSKEYVGPTAGSIIKTLQNECEVNLPRNQTCVMQFIPEKK